MKPGRGHWSRVGLLLGGELAYGARKEGTRLLSLLLSLLLLALLLLWQKPEPGSLSNWLFGWMVLGQFFVGGPVEFPGKRDSRLLRQLLAGALPVGARERADAALAGLLLQLHGKLLLFGTLVSLLLVRAGLALSCLELVLVWVSWASFLLFNDVFTTLLPARSWKLLLSVPVLILLFVLTLGLLDTDNAARIHAVISPPVLLALLLLFQLATLLLARLRLLRWTDLPAVRYRWALRPVS